MVRAQTSIEYLIIVGFAFAAIAILFIVYYEHDASTKAQVMVSQVDRIAKKVVDSAESVYFMGAPTRSRLKVYMPSNIEEITITNNEINFRVRTAEGISDLDYSTEINITGNLSSSQGIKYISVIAQPGNVCIVEEGQACP
jgi:uncharacterized protein (UPF0333 family)